MHVTGINLQCLRDFSLSTDYAIPKKKETDSKTVQPFKNPGYPEIQMQYQRPTSN